MRFLLDTHTFVWWASNSSRLSREAFAQCKNKNNDLVLSVASIWELQIKIRLGKFEFQSSLKKAIEIEQAKNNLEILPVSLTHVLELENLPLHHKDPFDRMLIAQAIVENLTIITRDSLFSQYPVPVLW